MSILNLESAYSWRKLTLGQCMAAFGLLGVVLLFLAGNELQFKLWGKAATGTVTWTRTQEAYSRRSHWTELHLEYTYTDADGTVYCRTDDSPLDSWEKPPAVGDPIAVQYLGDGGARLAIRSNPGVYVVLFVFVFLAFLWWSYSESESE
jgi:hypothetical protein